MSRYDYPDVSDATVRPISEDDLAAELKRDGATVRTAHGRLWRAYSSGFYEPLHRLARLSEREAQRPGLCWGFRATLDDGAAGTANASLPMHLITDIARHDESTLPRSGRRSLARLRRQGIRIVHVTDMAIFRDQGYEIMLEWRARIPRRGTAPPRDRFLAEAERRISGGGWLVLAALDDDRLLGYGTSRAIDDTAYLEQNRVASASLGLGLSSILDFEAVQVFRRTDTVLQATSDVHQPEMPTLAEFKIRHGFPVVRVPSRFWMLKPMEFLIQRRRPLTYYRLTGRDIERAMAGGTGRPDGGTATEHD